MRFRERMKFETIGQTALTQLILRQGARAKSIKENPYSVGGCIRSYCLWAAGFNDKKNKKANDR